MSSAVCFPPASTRSTGLRRSARLAGKKRKGTENQDVHKEKKRVKSFQDACSVITVKGTSDGDTLASGINKNENEMPLCRAAQNLPFDIFERIIPLIETVDLRRVSTISREFENLCLNELLRRIRFKEPESDYIIAGRYYRSLQYHEENREELLSLPLYSRAKNHRVPLNYLSVELSQNPDNAREDLKALTCFLQVNRLPTNAVSVYLLKTTGQSDYEDFILALRDAKTSFLNLGGHSTCIDFFDMDIDNPLLVNGLATDSFDHLRAVTIRTALVFSNGLSYHTVPLLCSPRLSNLCLDIVELEDSQWDAILSSITSQLQTFEVAGEVSFRTIAKFLSFQPNLQDLSIRSYLPLVASKISFSAAETVSGLPRNTRILGNLNKLTGSVGTILKVLSLIDPSTSPLKTITIQPSSSPSVFSLTALDSLQHMLKNFKVFALYIHIREVRQLKEIRRFKYSDIQQSERVRIRERERSATQVGIQEIYLYMVAQYDSYFFRCLARWISQFKGLKLLMVQKISPFDHRKLTTAIQEEFRGNLNFQIRFPSNSL